MLNEYKTKFWPQINYLLVTSNLTDDWLGLKLFI